MSALIREIRRIYPNAHITLIVYSRALNLAEICPYVDEVIPNARSYNWLDFNEMFIWNIKFSQPILENKFDIVYTSSVYLDSLMLAYMSGAKERISLQIDKDSLDAVKFPLYIMSPLVTSKVPVQLYGTHSVDILLGLLEYKLGSPVVNRDIEVWYSPLDFAFAKNILRNYNGKTLYALCMGGENLAKRWLPENYAKLAEMILKAEPNSIIIIIGGGKIDISFAEKFKQNLNPDNLKNKILDLIGKTTYRQSAAILSLCDSYIGNDTGTMHEAAAVKVPCLVPFCFPADINSDKFSLFKLFYPYKVPSVIVQPRHALPECKDSTDPSGCKIRSGPHCITQIKPETMFEAFNLLKSQIAKNAKNPVYLN